MFGRLLRCFAVLVMMLVVAGCGGALKGLSGGPNVEVPPESEEYSTSTGSSGVRGGSSAGDAEDLLEAALSARGDEAEPDAALAAVAAWILRSAYASESVSPEAANEAGYRFGFAGMLHGFIAGPLEQERTKAALKGLVDQLPKNLPINRYGIVAGQGTDVVVVLAFVEVSLSDFPRILPPGGKLTIEGEVDDHYERASVFLTNPEGAVREIPMKGRDIHATVEFPTAGIYRLEVMGYGSSGPIVLMNVPIDIGKITREASSTSEADPDLTAEDAESTLLALLNEERKNRGLEAVAADAELRAVALAHSIDMAEHGFASHVSPTTGTPEDRVKKARIRLSRVGECISVDATPAAAHRGLMESPAHRAAMIDPLFSHVGIGVTFMDSKLGARRLVATLVFGRRPAPEEARLSETQILDAIQAIRKQQKLPPLRVDPVLVAVAGAGARAVARGTAKTGPQALAAADREMQAQVNRTRTSRNSCQLYTEIIERTELHGINILKHPDLTNVGVGVAQLEDASGPKLAVVVLADAGPKKTIICK